VEGTLFSVFTKPWRTLTVWELGKQIAEWGFDGIEFPLRDGYQLEPKDAGKLPELVKQFGEHGLKIFSVASGTDERVFAGCAEAGIPIIRIIPTITLEEGYMASEKRERAYLESLLPLCEKYGVKIGIQQHYGDNVVDAMGMLHLLDGLNPRHVGAIWDSAHDALAGQQPEFGLDIAWPYLCMVNFKNAYYKRISGPEASEAVWKRHFTSGRQGLASWPRASRYLKERKFSGVISLTAEYSDETETDRLIQEDIAYVKSLFAEVGNHGERSSV